MRSDRRKLNVPRQRFRKQGRADRYEWASKCSSLRPALATAHMVSSASSGQSRAPAKNPLSLLESCSTSFAASG